MDWKEQIYQRDKDKSITLKERKMKTKFYGTYYDFSVEDSKYIAEGKCHISFVYDEVYDDVRKIHLDLYDFSIWDVIKEEEIINPRQYHIEHLKSMVEQKAIDYALEHDCTDDL